MTTRIKSPARRKTGEQFREAGRPSMPTDDLSNQILNILDQSSSPLRFRQIEAHVVLRGTEVSTYDVQRAVRELVEKGLVTQTEDFRYTKVSGVSQR